MKKVGMFIFFWELGWIMQYASLAQGLDQENTKVNLCDELNWASRQDRRREDSGE